MRIPPVTPRPTLPPMPPANGGIVPPWLEWPVVLPICPTVTRS